jgi:hypothetical protein
MSTNGRWELFPFKGDVSGRLAGNGRRVVSIREERVVPASISLNYCTFEYRLV